MVIILESAKWLIGISYCFFKYFIDHAKVRRATYFRERQSRGELNAFDTWLNASPDLEPMAGDELTWLGNSHNRFIPVVRLNIVCANGVKVKFMENGARWS